MSAERIEELAGSLAAVRDRITLACAAADRDPAEVTLVAVSKTWPASDVLLMASLGVTDFGESYDQEAAAKAGAVSAAGVELRWHFVGRLQRNKCRSIARYADVVQSVDRAEVADALSAGARDAGRDVDVLIQVSLDGDPARGGVAPAEAVRLAGHVASADRLILRGVMAVAPVGIEPRAAFVTLAGVAHRLAVEHPGATTVSAGMTGDLEEAIAEGATHVRVGTALFGPRATRG